LVQQLPWHSILTLLSIWLFLLPRYLPVTKPSMCPLQVLVDQSLAMPVFMAMLLTTQSLLAGRSWPETKDKLQEDWLVLVKGAWACWIPALLIGFSTVPLKYRLLYVNFVQIGFGVFLSKMVNHQHVGDQPQQPRQEDQAPHDITGSASIAAP